MQHLWRTITRACSFDKRFLVDGPSPGFLCRVRCLKIVGNGSVKPAALAELRREHTDATAVTQFVDVVQQVHDIEADIDRGFLCNLNAAWQARIQSRVRRNGFGVIETAMQSP